MNAGYKQVEVPETLNQREISAGLVHDQSVPSPLSRA